MLAREAAEHLTRGSLLVVVDPGATDTLESADGSYADAWTSPWFEFLDAGAPYDDADLVRAHAVAKLLRSRDEFAPRYPGQPFSWPHLVTFLVEHGVWRWPHWQVHATFVHASTRETWEAVLVDSDRPASLGRWGLEPPLARIFDDRDALAPIVEALQRTDGGLVRDHQAFRGELSFGLYDLTSLQLLAHRADGTKARASLQILQRLYETHRLISYPRTHGHYLPDDFALWELLSSIARWRQTPWAERAADLLVGSPPAAELLLDSSRVSDHHGLVPTGAAPTSLSDDEARLFGWIVERLLDAVEQPPTRWRTRRRDVLVAFDDEPLCFRAHASELLSRGLRQGELPPPRWMDGPLISGQATLVDFTVESPW